MTIRSDYFAFVTATGVPLSVNASTEPGFVRVTNTSLFGYSGTSVLPVVSTFLAPLSQTFAITTAATAPGLGQASFSSGGISIGNTGSLSFGNPLTITSITAANPAVVTTSTAHGLQSGDIVWIAEAIGMQQIAQQPYSIEVLSTTTFSLAFLNSSGFASGATGGSCVPVQNWGAGITPITGVITAITGGASTQVQFSVAQNLSSGQMIRFSIPELFGGFEQLNTNLGIRTAPNLGGYQVSSFDAATNTATVEVNSSGMGSFAFPSNATAAIQPGGIIQPAQGEPVGTYWSNRVLSGSLNTASYVINLGTAVCGRAGDVLFIEYGWNAN